MTLIAVGLASLAGIALAGWPARLPSRSQDGAGQGTGCGASPGARAG